MLVSGIMIYNYSNDATIIASIYKNEDIIRILENDITILSKWFWGTSMTINGEKCHLLLFSNMKNTNITIKIDNELTHESSSKLL